MGVQRWTALAGLAFVVLIVGTIVTGFIGPDVTDGSAKVAADLLSNRTDVLINSVLWMAAAVAFLCWTAGLATIFTRRDAGQLAARVLLVSGSAAAAASFVTAVVGATAAGSIDQLQDSGARSLTFDAS